MDTLLKASNGDLRKAITFLQSAATLHQNDPVTSETISELAGVSLLSFSFDAIHANVNPVCKKSIPEDTMQVLRQSWHSKKYTEIQDAIELVMNSGYSAEIIISQVPLLVVYGYPNVHALT